MLSLTASLLVGDLNTNGIGHFKELKENQWE